MRIVAVSDTHMGHWDLDLPHGDVLVHAGDATFGGTLAEVRDFLSWMKDQPFREKIFVAGNHDILFEQDKAFARELAKTYGVIYLEDEGTTLDGFRFWGSPWQPEFGNWAFNLPRDGERLYLAWEKIPEGTNVLITHGPPHEILDDGKGDQLLAERVQKIRPEVHIFGHIHEGYGHNGINGVRYFNASIMDEKYELLNSPMVIDL